MAAKLRDRAIVIDDETEGAVAGWVKLGDQVAGREISGTPTPCARCGSTDRVLDQDEPALCARCYLERGEQALAEESTRIHRG